MSDMLEKYPNKPGVPFVIWTVQRTGGTNLANMLFERSRWPTVDHEPFNRDRVFAHVVEQWHADKSSRQLDDIAARGVLIKHCVEIFGLDFNMALASALISKDYRHLFLFRRNSLDRLLSLHFAEVTGVWGKAMANKAKDKLLVESVPVERLVEREKKSISLMTSIYDHIQRLGGPVLRLAFEDIYSEEERERAHERILNLLTWLDMSRGEEEDLSFAEKVIGEGGQGTKSRYLEFPGVDALQDALSGLRWFPD